MGLGYWDGDGKWGRETGTRLGRWGLDRMRIGHGARILGWGWYMGLGHWNRAGTWGWDTGMGWKEDGTLEWDRTGTRGKDTRTGLGDGVRTG